MVRQRFFFVSGLGDVVFEIDSAYHPEGGVPAPTVVDHFNPVSHSLTRSIAGWPALPRVSGSLPVKLLLDQSLTHKLPDTLAAGVL